MRYTVHMNVLVILAIVVAVVAIDVIARLDERRPRRDKKRAETQTITVDLTKRE